MGYDVHITRRKDWSDATGPAISEQEWLVHARNDDELSALVWNRGNVDAKNPDTNLVVKMVAVAAAIGATVQGDDGESYDRSGKAVSPPQPGLTSRLANWVANTFSRGAVPLDPASLPFKVGDRVRDPWGNVGSVAEIDVRAEHGLGRVTVKFEGGRIAHLAAGAHGLERADV